MYPGAVGNGEIDRFLTDRTFRSATGAPSVFQVRGSNR
jgi:hypothetical protein